MTLSNTARTTIKRGAKRAVFDRAAMYQFLDASLIAHVAYLDENQAPAMIPTAHWRLDDHLYIHGSSASRTIRRLSEGAEACICITLLDGFVFARSGFHHSVNFRSAMIYAKGHAITDPALKLDHLERFTEKVSPGRWAQVRETSASELKGTGIVGFSLAEASFKVRQAPPQDDPADQNFPVWAGVIPLDYKLGDPIQDPQQTEPYDPAKVNPKLFVR